MRELTLKEENLIEEMWTAVEQWDECDGSAEGGDKKCDVCPLQNIFYDPLRGNEFHQCLKIVIEQIHEEAVT
jgi:hypothetical protein